MMLLLQIPFTFLCITLGGLAVDSILTVYLILAFIIWQLAPISVLASLIGTNLFSGAFILSGLYVLINFFFVFASSDFENPVNIPFLLLEDLLFQTQVEHWDKTIPYLIWLFISGGICFVLSTIWFNFLVEPKDELSLPKKLSGQKASNQSADKHKGITNAFFRLKSKRFGKGAVAYKDYKFGHSGNFLYLLQFSWIGFIFYWNYDSLRYSYNSRYYEQYYGEFARLYTFCQDCMPGIGISLLLLVAIAGSRTLAYEVKSNTFGSLMILPQTHIKLFWQKCLGALRAILPTFISFTGLSAAHIYIELNSDSSRDFSEVADQIIIYAIVITSFFLSIAASILVKKFSIFMSVGAVAGYFFGLIFVANTFFNSQESFIILCCVSGFVISIGSYIFTIKRMKKII